MPFCICDIFLSQLSIYNSLQITEYMKRKKKKGVFHLVSISAYSNQRDRVNESWNAILHLASGIINKTLILKDSCKFTINYGWKKDNEKGSMLVV